MLLHLSKFLVIASIVFIGLVQPSLADDSPAVSTLIKQLKDKDEAVRLKAAKELGKMKEKAKEAIPALKAALKDDDEDVRSVAKKSLEAIENASQDKDKPTDKLEAIIKDLKSKDNKVRLTALDRLGEMGEDAKPAGAAIVEFGILSKSVKVRDGAIAVFAKIDPEIQKEVVTLIIDENKRLKARAVETLGRLKEKSKAAVPAIKLYYTSGESIGFARTGGASLDFALEALVNIVPEDHDVHRYILSIVSGNDPGYADITRFSAIQLMNTATIENKDKYKALMTGLNATTRDGVLIIQTLGKLGSDAKGALPTLNKLKVNPNASIRQAAEEAIEAIKE